MNNNLLFTMLAASTMVLATGCSGSRQHCDKEGNRIN